MNPLAALDPFVRAWRAVAPAPERCGVCGEVVDDDQHDHLVDLEQRALLCACPGCTKLFADPAASGQRYRPVPTRVLVDPTGAVTDEHWAALGIPVRLAFLFHNSRLGRWVALYPSPGGATESEPPPEAIRELRAATRLLGEVQPDVEALLVYGRRGARLETFLVPIDTCYRLVGEVRWHWEGFQGGDEMWRRIERFFDDLRARARALVVDEAG